MTTDTMASAASRRATRVFTPKARSSSMPIRVSEALPAGKAPGRFRGSEHEPGEHSRNKVEPAKGAEQGEHPDHEDADGKPRGPVGAAERSNPPDHQHEHEQADEGDRPRQGPEGTVASTHRPGVPWWNRSSHWPPRFTQIEDRLTDAGPGIT